MRYMYIILAIMVVISFLIGYRLVGDRDDHQVSVEKPAVVINDKKISSTELDRLYNSAPYHYHNKREFIDSLIDKEILIQEANRQGINQKESFIRTIQDFYEQSLIRVLVDQQSAAVDVAIDAGEIDRFRELNSCRVSFIPLYYTNSGAGEKGEYTPGDPQKLPFAELSGELQTILFRLNPGEVSRIHKDQSGISKAYRLVEVEKVPAGEIAGMTDSEIENLLRRQKVEQKIDDWITHLRKTAQVEINMEEQ